MPRETFFPNPSNRPSGFSPITKCGNLLFVSGQVPVNSTGDLVGEDDCYVQAKQCFSNIEAALKSAGSTFDDLVKITAFIVRPEDYSHYAKVRLELFPENGPASSTVFISGLVSPEFLIEIEAIAALD
ncbi:MAG: RidA family protein [Chloroflexota bacterium]|nr:RidA family protein [Chloroflexota bacterium]